MIPTVVEGIQLSHNSLKNWNFNAGIFNRIAPRSTGKFYRIGQSFGQYPSGRNPDGTPSDYRDNTDSRFIGIAKAKWTVKPGLSLELTEYYIDQVFNTLHFIPAYQWQNNTQRTFKVSGEWVRQDRISDGGNSDPSKRYFSDKSANVFGVQVSTQRKTGWRMSYNRITSDGRFLFPREWGREFLFGFQKRERSEGSGDSHSIMLATNHTCQFGKAKLISEFSAAHHWRTDVSDPSLNKYAFPDYTHINADLFFTHSAVPNLRPEFLVTYKFSPDDLTENPNVVINKVDMWQINVIVNYRFN
jgi:hypothetical protein